MPPTSYARNEVERYAEAWKDYPEGCTGSPLFSVRFTPAGLLAFMDHAGLMTIEATIEPGVSPVTADVVPPVPDSLLRRIEAREAPVAPVGAPAVVPRGTPGDLVRYVDVYADDTPMPGTRLPSAGPTRSGTGGHAS